jgi:hypothetical protein
MTGERPETAHGMQRTGRAEPVEIDPERLRKAIRYLKGHPEQNDPRTWCTVPLDRNVGGQQLHRRGRHPQALTSTGVGFFGAGGGAANRSRQEG